MENVLECKDRLYSRDGRIKTMIMAGYDLHKDENGISYLGEEVIRRQHNKVVAGGAISLLRLMFGSTVDLNVTSLNELMGIGTDGTVSANEIPRVCLFNIGLGGCGASYADQKTVLDQQNCVDTMIPFRVVDNEEDITDTTKYWFHKQTADGKHAYYLKTFEGKPSVHCLFKDGQDGEDGTEVIGNPADYDRTEGIETFVEVILRVTAEDLREYFTLYDEPDYPRFNSIGLCVGQKGVLPDGTEEYTNVYQFSVLNFSNEMLHFDKDLSIIYRVYMS